MIYWTGETVRKIPLFDEKSRTRRKMGMKRVGVNGKINFAELSCRGLFHQDCEKFTNPKSIPG